MPSADSAPGTGTGASDAALRLLHWLNLAVGLVWTLGLVALASPIRIPLADRGVALGMLALFLVLPTAFVWLWRVERRRTAPRSGARKAYCIASRSFLALSWLPTWIPVLFWIAVWQPWPISLREGPDTAFARKGFVRLFGAPPSGAVHEIYYRVDGPRDPTFFLRCEGVDRARLDGVVQRLGLEPTAVAELRASTVGGRPPGRWPQDVVEPDGFDAMFQRNDGWTALWYRERGGLLLYREVTF